MVKGYSTAIARNPYIVGTFACIGGCLFGLDISSMSGVLSNPSYLKLFNYPSANAQGAMVASMPAGSLVGALSVGYLADKIGRKPTIMISGMVWVVGSILQSAAQNRGMLVAGRIISGFAIGMASSTVPLYQSEITAPAIRGRMVSLQQWAITWGILIQYFVQLGCSYINDGYSVSSIRIPWALQLIPGLMLSIGMFWFPESPRWLMDHDRPDDALEILADVHGQGDPNNNLVQLEYNEIKEAVRFERTEGAKSYKDLFAPGVFRRVILGTSLQMWSQLTGMNVMMYYIIYVFQGAGLTGRRGNMIASSVQYVLVMAATIPAIIYIDKWGRRPMLVIGLVFMAFWLYLVGGLQGVYGHWGEIDGARNWVITDHKSITYGIIVCSYLFVCSFAVTMGEFYNAILESNSGTNAMFVIQAQYVSWTYPSEIFPMRVRAKAVALSTASNWTFNFALAWAVPPALDTISFNTYFIFASFCMLADHLPLVSHAAFHVFFCFPETKGRTLEEIEDVFAQGHTFAAWKVKSTVGKKNIEDVRTAEKAESYEGKTDTDSEERHVEHV
ncbi:hypothetical protein BOTBODRAFT_180190 [Botryobasidium botryosum FD-172 SS1]|uniref:Major facilitator superfamily (MFS) profile domain-containing protein n=1 Tax=Botryobasidium botryosum (strain FD-172 SS1) TaxID=930990 RepID=A0A067LXU5_BOTB1|nr:hypothetical protein BOTBODRAFT_180190 [Botryobasidium botryosum FD-172 SS1]